MPPGGFRSLVLAVVFGLGHPAIVEAAVRLVVVRVVAIGAGGRGGTITAVIGPAPVGLPSVPPPPAVLLPIVPTEAGLRVAGLRPEVGAAVVAPLTMVRH